jgi:HPt (histidine-containing phosphotransfer) domain-containing protein
MDVSTREGEIRARLADIGGPAPGDGERALMARLVRSFVAKVPAGVDQLGELLRGGLPEAVCEKAHSLKGSAANIGADQLAAIFREVEDSARDGVVPDPDMTLGRIAAEQALVLGLLDGVANELETA